MWYISEASTDSEGAYMHFQYCPHCGKKAERKQIGDEGLIPYCTQCEVPLWDMFTTSIIAEIGSSRKPSLITSESVN